MSLNIENFEKDIIIDEVILQNKEEYLLKDIHLSAVKAMLIYYMDEYLCKNNDKVSFEEALGSTLNIGKMLINSANMNHDCVVAINSQMWKPDKKFELIYKKYEEIEVDLKDEVYAKSIFSVVPNYVMTALSYIKLELLRSKKELLKDSRVNVHRLSRVIELYLKGYHSSMNPEVGFRLISEADLFSIGNLYLNFISYIVQNGLKANFNHRTYSLVEFMDKKDVHVNDIMYFINSFEKIKEFNNLDILSQVNFARYYHWLPDEIYELQSIGNKISQIAKSKLENKNFKLSDSESSVLKVRIEDSLEKFRLMLYNNHKKYYNVGIDLGGEYVFEVMKDIIKVIEADINYICSDGEPGNLDRNCLYYGDLRLVTGLFNGTHSIMSILEANSKGE